MVYLPMDDMLKKSDSIYKLVMLVCARAKELNEGVPPLIESKSQKWITVALEELKENKINYKRGKESRT